jgi:hypothetical protein
MTTYEEVLELAKRLSQPDRCKLVADLALSLSEGNQ